MAQVSRRAGFNGSALVRLLSRLTDTDVRESAQGTADRLSQWFGWTDAISLSAALNGNPAPALPGARTSRTSASAEEGECIRARSALAQAIAEDGMFADGAPSGTASDFAPYRQRYLARQQAMDAGVGPLRGRLRARLATGSADMARLAAVDVVMEQVLGTRERSLLANLPSVLERHFGRLRQAAAEAQVKADDEPGDAAAPEAWLDVFRKDARELLLAELDFRFQPVEGLLEALRSRTTGQPDT